MSDYSDIVNSYKDMSVSELGGSLLQRKGEIADKQRKRDKKDMRIQQALGVLLAGQGLMKNAFKRRQKELANQQTLDLLTADSDAKQIQNLSTIYNYKPVGYNSLEQFTKEINPETNKVYTVQENVDRFFKNQDNNQGFKGKISPLIDQQLQFSDQKTMETDNPRAYGIVREVAAKSLFEQMITGDNHIKYLNGLEKFFNDDGLTRDDILKESLKLDKGRYSQYQRQKYARKEAELSNQGMLGAFGGFIKSLGDDQEAKGNLNLFKKLKPEDLQTPELREVLDSLNVRGIVLEAVDKGLQASRQSPQRYLNMVNNKKYEGLRTNMTDVVLLDLARDVDDDLVFERYGLQSYIDDGVFEDLQKDMQNPSVRVNFEKRAAALSLRLLEDKQFALQLIKNAGAEAGFTASNESANFIKQLENDEFRNKFAVLAVLQAGKYDPGFFNDYKFKGAIDPLSGLGMERPDPQKIKTNMGFSDKQSGDKLDPVLNPMFNLKTGEATKDYVKLSPRGKDNAYYSMALQILNSKNGTEADKLQALEDFNNTTPNPRNLPIMEYLQVKEQEKEQEKTSTIMRDEDGLVSLPDQSIRKGALGTLQSLPKFELESSIKSLNKSLEQLNNKEGRYKNMSVNQITRQKNNIEAKLKNYEQALAYKQPEEINRREQTRLSKVYQNKIIELEKELNNSDDLRPSQITKKQKELEDLEIQLDLVNNPNQPSEPEEENTIELDIKKPRAVGKDVTFKAIDTVVNVQGVSDSYKDTSKTFLQYLARAESDYGENANTFNNPQSNATGIFQIIPSKAFFEVQRVINKTNFEPNEETGADVRAYNELLKDQLGIDLATATEADLETPLYSAAFARAYLMRYQPSIPTDPLKMAEYYADAYVKDPDTTQRDKYIRRFLLSNGFIMEGGKQTLKSLLDFN